MGIIKRISVSVALDYISAPSAEGGEAILSPRTTAELANIRRLLQGSIGFNLARGDVLEVVTMSFFKEDFGDIPEPPMWEQPWFLRVIKMIMGALIIIVILLFLVRPMLNRLISSDVDVEDDTITGDLSEFDDQFASDTVDMLAASDGDYSYAEDGSIQLPDLRKDDDLLRAVRALVSNEPDLSIQVIKNWLHAEK